MLPSANLREAAALSEVGKLTYKPVYVKAPMAPKLLDSV